MSDFLQVPPAPPDAWAGDRLLQETVLWHLGDDMAATAEPELAAMGERAVAPETLALVARAERELPEHVPYSAWGERIDEIRVSDAYYELGRIGIEAGVTALPYEDGPYGERARIVWGALVALWGPSSALYSCPVAMTDAAARTLLLHGDESDIAVAARLTTRDFGHAWTSGQWMTEMTGGSDVGRTSTIARRDGDVWRLWGTKWFTSATTSEMALTLARPDGAAAGSAGLALWRIHRVLDDGSRNGILVRRLKDKLGTRSMPTAELELQGAIATPVGDPMEGGGVRRIATMLNLTRVHNAIAAAGALGRGLGYARSFAAVREAFGRPLSHQPAHRATLADLAVDYAATLALVMRCCELTGLSEHDRLDESRAALLRGLTPVTKLATARWAVAGAAEIMEAVGGVGYCEDSMIPALVRNAHVLPIWEGTTNVLALDLLRAEARSGAVAAIIADARDTAGPLATSGPLSEAAGAVMVALDEIERRLRDASVDLDQAQAHARSIALSLGSAYACARLCAQGAWGLDRGDGRTAAAARRLAARRLVAAAAPADLELAMDDGIDVPAPITSP